jgi:poly-D-alanine transfer protein DltD
MKQILAAYILPACISLFLVYRFAANPQLNNSLFPKPAEKSVSKPFVFIENFKDAPECEDLFLQDDSAANIFLLGSSELTGETEASPYRFISLHFSTNLKSVGHAGNQCFSIYSQLLANEDRLKDARIVVILSPMWFFSKEAAGTSSAIFLEFNSENFLNRIIHNDSIPAFKAYENRRVSGMFSEFSSPGLALKQMHFGHQSSISPVHYLLYQPILKENELLLKIKSQLEKKTKSQREALIRIPVVPDTFNMNWDSILSFSRSQILTTMTNNSWGINNEYFSEHIKGKTSNVRIGPLSKNNELEDFRMLLKLLKEKKANASFIIIPMNPYYYINLKDADPIISTIESEIKQAEFPYLSYWVTDTSKYEKGVLRDVMHLSDYGWHKANRFITETYHLTK